MDRLMENAKSQMTEVTAQLVKVRQESDAETAPLTKKLSELEAKLLEVRAKSNELSLSLDVKNLDISNIKGELKLKEDEANYVTTLLDEYVRGFETKIHLSEAPLFKAIVEKAKQLVTELNSTQADKTNSQLSVVSTSLERAKRIMGGTRFEGAALSDGREKNGKFALFGPFVFFASDDGDATGITVQGVGSSLPVVNALAKELNGGIQTFIASGSGSLPLDSTNGSALKALLHKSSLLEVYKHGGPIMHPILLLSIIALAVVLDRVIFMSLEASRRNPAKVMDILEQVEKGDLEKAVYVGRSTKDYVARTLVYALEHREKGLSNALMLAASKELKRFGRGIPILDTAITLSPLLGLLGTVTGMMHSFSLIGGDLSAPGAITGGISEALIATAFGLAVAIIAVIPLNILNAQIDEARHDIEAGATRLELLLHTPGATGAPKPMRLPQPAATGGGGGH